MLPRFLTRRSVLGGGLSRGAAACRGFTLIELLTVVAIIGILASISFGVIRGINDRAAVGTAKAELAMLAQGLEAYRQFYGDYPQVNDNTPEKAGRYLYLALNGALGPTGEKMTRDTAKGTRGTSRSFIDNTRMTARLVKDAGTGNVTVDVSSTSANYYTDPWGRPYRYRYDPKSAGWKANGYILFSVGSATSKTEDDLDNSNIKNGEAVTSGKAADNIYANEN